MQLDDKQKNVVSGWIEEGLDLSAIQVRLETEFNISMTYMDVRFLVGDLKLVPKDLEEPEDETDGGDAKDQVDAEQIDQSPDSALPPSDNSTEIDGLPEESNSSREINNDSQEAGDVAITVSSITKPGMMASGSVTFSDGVTCDWYVDELGRPGLVPPAEGYQPPEADMPKFGQKLQQSLQGGRF